MPCGVFCFSLHLFFASGLTVSIPLPVFSVRVIASLSSLIQGGFYMGALRTRMIDEKKLRNFSPRTQQSYLAAMIGLVKYHRRSPDQLMQEEIRAYLLHLEKRGLSLAQRGDLGNEVLLSSDAGLG